MTEEQQKSGADVSDLRETPMEAEPGFLEKRTSWMEGWEKREITIADAVEILREKPECAQELTEKIISQGQIGSDEDFLALIDLLRARHRIDLAYKMNRHAWQIFKYSGDFYANEIEMRLSMRNARTANEKVEDLLDERMMSCWTYRLGRAACSYYWHLAKITEPEKRRSYIKTGLSLARCLQREQPQNEWGYYWEIEFLWQENMEAACELLMKCLWRVPDQLLEQNQDSLEVLCCPRCCRLYIERVLSQTMSSDWSGDNIRQAAEKGLQYVAALYLRGPSALEEEELLGLDAFFRRSIQRADWFRKTQEQVLKKPAEELMFCAGIPFDHLDSKSTDADVSDMDRFIDLFLAELEEEDGGES